MKQITSLVFLPFLLFSSSVYAMVQLPLQSNSSTELHQAAWNGNLERVKELVLNDTKKVNARHNHATPLHYAAGGGHEAVVNFLLENDAEINIADIDGNTPLHNAVYYERESIVRLLLEKGANDKLGDTSGWTPLNLAEKCTTKKRIENLLKNWTKEHTKKSTVDFKSWYRPQLKKRGIKQGLAVTGFLGLIILGYQLFKRKYQSFRKRYLQFRRNKGERV